MTSASHMSSFLIGVAGKGTLRTLLFACTNFSVLVSPCIWRGLILAVLMKTPIQSR